jgi:PAS domain S-box-containing protein
MQALIQLFGIKDLIPHGYCLSWSPVLLWLNVISDLLITLAYYSIPLTLVYFIRQRKDFPYPWLVALFAGFIVACGTTHLMSAITIWIPLYWLDGLIKAFTAIISLTAAALMLRIIPGALALPSSVQLQAEIQQRKTAEEALRESENKLATILDSVEAFIYIKDCNYQYRYANQPVLQMLGKNLENLIGSLDDAIFDQATAEKLRENDRRVIELGERIATEEVNTGINNANTRTYLSIKQPLRRKDGTIYGLCGISTDISDRKQAEDALRESRMELQEAQRIAHVGSWKIDLSTLRVDWSEELYRILGWNPESPPPDYTGHSRFFTSDSWKSLSAALLQTRKTGEPYELELDAVRTDGEYRKVLARGEAILDGSGAVAGLHGVALDITERKQMEEKLRDSRALNVSIINSLNAHIAVLDAQGIIIAVNRAWRQFAEENSSEEFSRDMLGVNYLDECKTVCNLTYTDEANAARTGIAAVLAGEQEIFHLEYPCHSPAQQRWFYMTVLPLQGLRRGVVVSHENITERKIMENELKASEEKFRSIFEVSPVPMALNDEQLNITFVNPAFVQTFGYSVADIPTLADWWPKAYPDPAYREWVKASWQTAYEKSQREQTSIPPVELIVRCKNNSIKTVLISAAAIHHDLVSEYLVILYDITQRKQLEAKLNAIFNAAVEGIITIDKSGVIVSANTAVEAIFGYKPEELTGCGIDRIMPPLSKEKNDYYLTDAAKAGAKIQEIEGLRKNGSVVPVDQSIAEYAIDNERYFTYIVRDVSLRKQRERQNKEHLDQLAHVTRLGLMGEMASGIAHEVNQPLSAISSYTQVSLNLINMDNPDLVKLAEVLYKTQQQALRAGRIIHRMREFIKSHSKQSSSASINTLIEDAVSLCAAELKQNGIELTLQLDNDLPPIFVDHIHIEQVMINLIRNSIDALQNQPADQQRQLNIHSRLTLKNAVQVRIKDNGPGIDNDRQQKIFMPFYTTKADGMGMGLSISRSLLEAHGGTLYFKSKPGKGCSFYFTLPTEIT